MGKATKRKGFLLVAIMCGVLSLSSNANAIERDGQTKETDSLRLEQHELLRKQGAGKLKYDNAFAVLDIVNAKRKSAGLKPYIMDESLLKTANVRVKEIAKTFSHVRPNGESCFSAYKKGGMLGENIAYGYTSASSVMKGWMQSSGHKRNIMEKEFQSIGIGCYYQNGHYYWVQCFSSEEGSPVSSAEEAKQLCGDTASLDNDGQVTMKISGAKLKPGKKSLVLSWSKINGVKGYQIQISTGKAFSKSKRSEYTASASKKSYSIKKLKGKRLKAKKKYYVRIRAYQLDSEGGKTFGKWKVLNAKTK